MGRVKCAYSRCKEPPVVRYGQLRAVGLCGEHFHLFDTQLEVIEQMGYEPEAEARKLRQLVLDWAREAGDARPKAHSVYRSGGGGLV